MLNCVNLCLVFFTLFQLVDRLSWEKYTQKRLHNTFNAQSLSTAAKIVR